MTATKLEELLKLLSEYEEVQRAIMQKSLELVKLLKLRDTHTKI